MLWCVTTGQDWVGLKIVASGLIAKMDFVMQYFQVSYIILPRIRICRQTVGVLHSKIHHRIQLWSSNYITTHTQVLCWTTLNVANSTEKLDCEDGFWYAIFQVNYVIVATVRKD